MTLIALLNKRYKIAKAFTKNFHEEIKEAMDVYEAKSSKSNGVHNKHVKKDKFDITIPYVFATHESMLASFFEKMPEIVIGGRSAEGVDKGEMLKSIYSYLEDKCDLDEFLTVSAWWFFLVGFVSAHVDYKIELDEETPLLDEMGQPMIDEMGQPTMIPTYEYHDPVVSVDDMEKVYFSPESEFTIDASKVPYYFKERLMDVEEIKEIYGKEVEPDEELKVDDLEEKDATSDLKRAKVKYYYGRLPQEQVEELELEEPWNFNQDYKVYFAGDTVLTAEVMEQKHCKLARLYAKQNKFFGFGISKTLAPFQDQMSIRRSQQLKYANKYANPWLVVDGQTTVSQKEILDNEKKTPLVYTGEKPEYLQPPQIPSVITDADNYIRSDAQFVSGTLDISKGAQETNTVKTATGQQLFAQSQDKRLQKARKAIAKYYREVVISMFKRIRDNWDGHDPIYYRDEETNQDVEITAEMLQAVDFDSDVDFNLDKVSVNRDIMSQRWVSLLEIAKDSPFINSKEIFEKVLVESFMINNPEKYSQEEPPMGPDGQPMPPEMPGGAPVENPENVPGIQPLGSQLAPQAPYEG